MGTIISEPDVRLRLLPEIIRRILAVSRPEKIILFGSFARGEYGPDSDLGPTDAAQSWLERARSDLILGKAALRGVWAQELTGLFPLLHVLSRSG